MTFNQKAISRIEAIHSAVCVGLDSRYDRLPSFISEGRSIAQAILAFNRMIIDQTAHVAAAYKMNVAFYGGFGAEGLEGLRLTNEFLQENHPSIPILADCKRSEMGDSVRLVKQEIFDWLGFDCVMVTPWFGEDTVRDYLDEEKNGVCVYVHDSNPSAVDIQAVKLENGLYLYEYLCDLIVQKWNTNGNVFVEAGATYPQALKRVRERIGEDMLLLTAGVGAQGGEIEDVLAVRGKNKQRLLVNSSRGIIFPTNEPVSRVEYQSLVKKAAETLRDQLRQ